MSRWTLGRCNTLSTDAGPLRAGGDRAGHDHVRASTRCSFALGVKREAATGRALVMPWVIGFLIFNVFTIGASLYLSFTEYNLFKAPEWVGLRTTAIFQRQRQSADPRDQRSSDVLPRRLQEVQRVNVANGGFVFGAKEDDFWRAMRLTLPYAFLSVPAGMIAALGVAMLLNQKVKLLGFWRVLYYMPAILPAVATALLWRWIFSPNSGLLNSHSCAALQPAWRGTAALVHRSQSGAACVHHHQPVGRLRREFGDFAGRA